VTAVTDDLLCLGVPALVLTVSADGLVATVDCFGARHLVRLELVDTRISPGDYVLNHVGYAIRRIPDDDIAETLACYEALLRGMSDDELAGGLDN
jgi:hydrogenase expression/formation protein HypC